MQLDKNGFQQKRENLILKGIIFLCAFCLFSFASIGSQIEVKDIYKTGVITLKNKPGFGEETDWDTLFYNAVIDITVAPDGSIFAASSRQHTIFKFDSNGKLIKSFGQKGQGPGDFNGPCDLSVLDGIYLVVGESPLSHRISLFDLEGHFVKVLKTTKSVFNPIALRDGKIAYVSLSHVDDSRDPLAQIQIVYIKDISSQEEIKVSSYKTVFPRTIPLKSGTSFSFGEETGAWTYLSLTKDRNLIVGISNQPVLTVYSPDGEKLYEITLRGKALPLTRSVIQRFKESMLNKHRRNSSLMQELEKADLKLLFDEYLPLYRALLTDEAGHILVFRRDGYFFEYPNTFEVYTSEGDFICETEIKTRDYKLLISRYSKHMCFTDDGLIALVEPLNSPQFRLEIIKVAY